MTTSEARGSEKSVVEEVVLGVDTHLDVHVAVVLDRLGRRLGELAVPTTAKGYESLTSWAEGFGSVEYAGVEGTGSYGAGLARHLRQAGIPVFEVERPKRRHLRRDGNSCFTTLRKRRYLCLSECGKHSIDEDSARRSKSRAPRR